VATALANAKAAKDSAKQKTLKAELVTFNKRLARQITDEARQLVKTRFDYPVFLYEAEKMGLSATGEPDVNELYPNPRQPAGITVTALEQYRAFEKDPKPFFV
jgi:type I restriction enzyme M protein